MKTYSVSLRNERTKIFFYALVSAMVFIVIVGAMPFPKVILKLLFDKGEGSIFPYPLTVQNLMWLVFFVGSGELYFRRLNIKEGEDAIKMGYLPEQDNIVLTVQDMGEIYKVVNKRNNYLAELIKSLVLRFQAGQSVEQTHQMLTSHLELRQYRMDIDYNMVRYISWLIPTLGFIGTVVGIAQTLNYAGAEGVDPKADGFLADITLRLGVAFDTTFIALVMSAMLVFATHIIQAREERSIIEAGQYCLDNLITRIFVPN